MWPAAFIWVLLRNSSKITVKFLLSSPMVIDKFFFFPLQYTVRADWAAARLMREESPGPIEQDNG